LPCPRPKTRALSKHQGGNAVSTADHFDPNEAKKWKRDVLEAYLGADEWETMKSHVKFGAKILDPLTPLARIREMVLHHHEYFDGSGYPEALAGEKIPLGARIIAIADAYDTITSDRTYKKARKAGDALAELERCANAQFDGAIVEIFVRTLRAMPNPVTEVAATTGRGSTMGPKSR
jgi:HD-GYP domain-containing protein (c-di-GMP phosphodiesterase class II)